jgi:hypothetical protein
MTKRSINDILNKANRPNEFLPPTPYMISHCIQVTNYKKIKKIISNKINSKKVIPKSDFFKISIEELNDIFDNIDTD